MDYGYNAKFNSKQEIVNLRIEVKAIQEEIASMKKLMLSILSILENQVKE